MTLLCVCVNTELVNVNMCQSLYNILCLGVVLCDGGFLYEIISVIQSVMTHPSCLVRKWHVGISRIPWHDENDVGWHYAVGEAKTGSHSSRHLESFQGCYHFNPLTPTVAICMQI